MAGTVRGDLYSEAISSAGKQLSSLYSMPQMIEKEKHLQKFRPITRRILSLAWRCYRNDRQDLGQKIIDILLDNPFLTETVSARVEDVAKSITNQTLLNNKPPWYLGESEGKSIEQEEIEVLQKLPKLEDNINTNGEYFQNGLHKKGEFASQRENTQQNQDENIVYPSQQRNYDLPLPQLHPPHEHIDDTNKNTQQNQDENIVYPSQQRNDDLPLPQLHPPYEHIDDKNKNTQQNQDENISQDGYINPYKEKDKQKRRRKSTIITYNTKWKEEKVLSIEDRKKLTEPIYVKRKVKLPDRQRLSYNLQLLYSHPSYRRYRRILNRAEELIASKRLDEALDHYNLVKQQQIPQALCLMIESNIEELKRAIVESCPHSPPPERLPPST